MANNHSETERRLWAAADEFRANSELRSSEYSTPVLGLIFLRYADHRFIQAEKELEGKGSGRRTIGKEDYQAKGVMYLPPKARFSHLLSLPEGENIGKAINEAMKSVELENEELKGVLPKSYTKIDNAILVSLLKNFSQIAVDADGDKFGKIYEYFLGNFARAEGQRGGEFFTPTSLVQLIVEIIAPHHGRLMDPSCGSGGMYVQSAKFIKSRLTASRRRRRNQDDDLNHAGSPKRKSAYASGSPLNDLDPSTEISCYGQERVEETRNLCLMNLAVHGLSGDIKQGNSYYEDLHECEGKFDFVMANPPFNVDKVDKERIKDDPRFPFGMPRSDNANYLWIQLFYSSLNKTGRAGFVMANSAADARQSEMEIRKQLLQDHAVDVMVTIGPNFFYTVTLPCTLWFFDKAKSQPDASAREARIQGKSSKSLANASGSDNLSWRRDRVLFINARDTFRQVDRAHRKFSPKQVEYLANIVRLYRGEKPEFLAEEDDEFPASGSTPNPDLKATFPKLKYADVAGLCKVATLEEIEAQGWSLNPGRYVGVADREEDDFVFAERLEELNEELTVLNSEASELEERIANNVAKLLEEAT
ncbi:MAG TPA: class I SAM-dependent DNA methyltransferase [Planctomycetaceae bacterium]|nr:class I SAM-dependent DNA methyltransferase [Planctomycetaceae bacterium]